MVNKNFNFRHQKYISKINLLRRAVSEKLRFFYKRLENLYFLNFRTINKSIYFFVKIDRMIENI